MVVVYTRALSDLVQDDVLRRDVTLLLHWRRGVASEKAFRAGQKLSPTRLQRYKATSTARNTARHGTAQTIVTDTARSTEHGTAWHTARNTEHGTRNTEHDTACKTRKHCTEHGTAQTIVTDTTGHGTARKPVFGQDTK